MPRVLTDEEKAFLTRPHERRLWGQPHTVTPVLVSEVLGDGEKLLILSPLMTRPNYYVVQIDSSWDIDGEEFRDHLDEIYDAVEMEFGSDAEDEDAPWPALCGGGSTWGEIEDLAAEMKMEGSPAAA